MKQVIGLIVILGWILIGIYFGIAFSSFAAAFFFEAVVVGITLAGVIGFSNAFFGENK